MSAPHRPEAAPGAAPDRADPQRLDARPQPGPRLLWTARQDGRTIFRHPAPVVLWWCWAAFALINICYLVIDNLTIYSVRGIAGLLAATGIVYACTLHARVEADAEGATIFNPLREHSAPWGVVERVSVGDSVEFTCTRPAPKKAKKIYSWALYSSRRSRARAQLRTSMFSRGPRRLSSRSPAAAADLAGEQPGQIMAAELGRRAAAARDQGIGDGALRSQLAVLPLAAIVVPATFLLVTFLIR